MIDYSAILTLKYPNTLWSLSGDEYENLEWFDEITEKPDQKTLDSLWKSVQTEISKLPR